MIEMVYILHRLRENFTLRRDKAKSLITFVITVESTLSCLSFYICSGSSFKHNHICICIETHNAHHQVYHTREKLTII